jgi:hypothetical protein
MKKSNEWTAALVSPFVASCYSLSSPAPWADWGNMINWLIFSVFRKKAFYFLTFRALVCKCSRHRFSDDGCLHPCIVLIGMGGAEAGERVSGQGGHSAGV